MAQKHLKRPGLQHNRQHDPAERPAEVRLVRDAAHAPTLLFHRIDRHDDEANGEDNGRHRYGKEEIELFEPQENEVMTWSI